MTFIEHRLHRISLRVLCALVVVITLAAALPHSVQAGNVPVLTIVKVVTDDSVTIKVTNSPKDTAYTVRMGEYGSYGIGGYVAGTITTTNDGTAEKTFSIPAELKGKEKIAIRVDGPVGYYAYNWFTNQSTGTLPPPPPGYSGFPTFSILSVTTESSVTIQTANLPPNQSFTVRMGKYGTYAIGGTEVGTFESGSTPVQKLTFNIPAGLKGNSLLAIRFDSAPGYFAYNWFYNTASGVTPPPVLPGYSGYPTFSIRAVVRDGSVTVAIKNLPPNQTFTVRMGAYGTYGKGGIEVASFDSGSGGALEKTFSIPAGLAGSAKIAIRMDSNLGFFAYNWFYNNSTP